ncbi:MAG TPA: hypothetical protein ENG54_00755 [Thermofilum sp.]|nr:hypothetical protein [Thermofilum sp.]
MNETAFMLFAVYLLTLLLALSETYSLSVSALLGALFTAWLGINYGLFGYEEALGFIDVKLAMLLIGIMITVETASRSGLFRVFGLYAIKLVRANPKLLLIVLGILSAAVSLFLSDAAAVLIVSATALAISKDLGYDPIPYVTTAAIMVNLGGTGMLIGSVSNMIIGLNAGFSFTEFSQYLLPAEFMLWFITVGVLALYYGKKLETMKPRSLVEYKIKVERKGEMLRAGFILFLMIVLYIYSDRLGLPVEAVAMAVAVIALAVMKYDSARIFSEIDWDTVFFVIAFLFVIRGVEKTGILNELAQIMFQLSGGEPLLTSLLTLFVSGIASVFLANVAVALTFTPAVKALPLAHKEPVWSALVLGTNLGGGTIPVTSIVFAMAIGALKHEEVSIDLGELTKVGAMVTTVQLLFSALYIIVYFGVISGVLL